jgi:hypothetical protein
VFGADRFRSVRHDRNLGGVPNLSAALAESRGEWVWSLGDDDTIHDGATELVVRRLQQQPDLAALFLNFRGVHARDGKVRKEFYFDPEAGGRFEDGGAGFSHHVDFDIGSVIFLTATVYRTDLAREAINAWRGGEDNWFLCAFWAGHVAKQGPVYVHSEVVIDCLLGVSHWMSEHESWRKATYRDIPRVCLALADNGYDPAMCKRIGFRHMRRGGLRAWAGHVKAIRYCPQYLILLPRLFALRWR